MYRALPDLFWSEIPAFRYLVIFVQDDAQVNRRPLLPDYNLSVQTAVRPPPSHRRRGSFHLQDTCVTVKIMNGTTSTEKYFPHDRML